MCSTAEEWSSCLGLQNTCPACYWTGLPGIIGDKNRAMVYVTDGTKKNYRGIIVDKMITRSWIITMRNDKKSPTNIVFINSYPGIVNLREIASSAMNIKLYDNDEDGGQRSTYYFDMLYHNYSNDRKVNCNIYQDGLEVHIAKKNKAKDAPFKYGYYKAGGRGRDVIFIKKDKMITDDDGGDVFYMLEDEELDALDYLISKEKSIASFRDE
jgi:hypothetical protein